MNAELRSLFEQDQADRLADVVEGGWPAIAERDRQRRQRVDELIDAGGLQASHDYYHAAMVFQHGDSLEHYWRAHELAKKAAELGDGRGRWLAAAAYDRWLMHQGKPQKYGTQYKQEGDRYRLWDVDPVTTDQERAQWDVPALDIALRRAESRPLPTLADNGQTASQRKDLTHLFLQDPPLVALEVPGLRVEIKLWLGPSPPAGRPKAQPRPLPPGEGVVPANLPASLVPCHLDGGYCAIGPDGEAVVSWRSFPLASGTTYIGGWLKEYGAMPPLTPVDVSGRACISIGSTAQTPHQLVARSGPATCWLVSGQIPQEELLRVLAGLPVHD